ncbi:MAG: hypothetical protein CBB60_004960 [Armatimonadetes bacterium Cent15-Ar3]|nr:MAG: hypothetical protein CBB60_004960 [Armatimonadetes bacterium Cent15-Ar3]
MSENELSFEEWFSILSSFDSDDEAWNADERMVIQQPERIATYLERLFSESGGLCHDVSPVRLSHMINFFQGVCGSYWHDVRDKSVPKSQQISTVRALSLFYRDTLDQVCDGGGRTPATNTHDLDDLDGTVYMMWDMNCIEGAAMFPGEEHLVDPIFEVLTTAIRCKTVACQLSGLHGLNHLEPYHPKRVHLLIQLYLKEERAALSWLNFYAKDAMRGALI